MANLFDFAARWSNVTTASRLYEVLFTAIKTYEKEALQYNKDALSKGENTDGGILKGKGPYTGFYKPYTVWKSENESPKPIKPKVLGARYNMEWSGDLFKEMRLIFGNQQAIFDSEAESLKKLLDVGFTKILGFKNEDQVEYLKTYIMPEVLRILRINLKLT